MLVLVVMFVVGAWVLIGLLLQVHRDAAVDNLVAAHTFVHGTDRTGGAGAEEVLIQQIQKIESDTRAYHVLVGGLAVLVLFAMAMSDGVTRVLTAFTDM